MRTDPETEATGYAVGIGIVLIQVFALFPGALACLLLLVPLLLPPLLLGLLVAPFYGLWKLGKWALASRGGGETAPYATGSGSTRFSAAGSPSERPEVMEELARPA